MAWIKRFNKSVIKHTNESTQEKILEGGTEISSSTKANERAQWIMCAVEKLDNFVCKEVKKNVLFGCSDLFPKARIKPLRNLYLKTKNVDAILLFMHKDATWGGLSYYEYPHREGNTIYVTKNPYNPKKYKETSDPEKKKLYYCHCGIVKAALKSKDVKLFPNFCFCGGGWYKSLWEGILEKPVDVEIVQSITKGDDCCKFAIHLPI